MMRLPGLFPLLLVACNSAPGQTPGAAIMDTANVPAFNADSAHSLIRHQVAFGPRVPGMPGHDKQLAWMTQRLGALADTVSTQQFTHKSSRGGTLAMTNVFARFNPEAGQRILLIAHWDTRPTSDNDPQNADLPIDGANDGASGVAVLMEIASVLARNKPPIGVDLLFVDGEDYGPGESDMYLGAKHFAANMPQAYKPLYGILVDMVGDEQPVFLIEGNSQDAAPEVVERVWRTAEQLGLRNIFVRRSGGHINDDHLPLIRAGIRTIDIIDFDYGQGNEYWHSQGDIVEHTSPVGLGAVGKVLLTLIWNRG